MYTVYIVYKVEFIKPAQTLCAPFTHFSRYLFCLMKPCQFTAQSPPSWIWLANLSRIPETPLAHFPQLSRAYLVWLGGQLLAAIGRWPAASGGQNNEFSVKMFIVIADNTPFRENIVHLVPGLPYRGQTFQAVCNVHTKLVNSISRNNQTLRGTPCKLDFTTNL